MGCFSRDILWKHANSDSGPVLAAVVDNDHTDGAILEHLSHHSNPVISVSARARLQILGQVADRLQHQALSRDSSVVSHEHLTPNEVTAIRHAFYKSYSSSFLDDALDLIRSIVRDRFEKNDATARTTRIHRSRIASDQDNRSVFKFGALKMVSGLEMKSDETIALPCGASSTPFPPVNYGLDLKHHTLTLALEWLVDNAILEMRHHGVIVKELSCGTPGSSSRDRFNLAERIIMEPGFSEALATDTKAASL